jgi:hypothetical protein
MDPGHQFTQAHISLTQDLDSVPPFSVAWRLFDNASNRTWNPNQYHSSMIHLPSSSIMIYALFSHVACRKTLCDHTTLQRVTTRAEFSRHIQPCSQDRAQKWEVHPPRPHQAFRFTEGIILWHRATLNLDSSEVDVEPKVDTHP